MSLPEKLRDSLEQLSKLYFSKYPRDINNNSEDFLIFRKCVEKNFKLAYKNKNIPCPTDALKQIYNPFVGQFVKERTYQIPDGILPENKIGFLTDIKVELSKSTQRNLKCQGINGHKLISDDYGYKENPILQKTIPRGVLICKTQQKQEEMAIEKKIEEREGKEEEKKSNEFDDVCIYGIRKFTGLNTQDDDDEVNTEGNNYFIQDINTKKNKSIFMEKMNGEAFHFSGRYIQKQFYYFVGSKNNHIMIRNEDDIHLYPDSRYIQAKKFAKCFMKLIETLPINKLHILQNLLHYTKVTAVCEILQPLYQHIVLINGNQDEIIFLAFSSTFTDCDNNSLTAFPPHIAMKIIDTLNISSANYKIYEQRKKDENVEEEEDDEEEKKEIENIRHSENSEGVVIYFLNINNETIGMLKLKAFWYIFLRALRQKLSWYLRYGGKKSKTDLKEFVKKRYDELQQSFGLNNDQIMQWKIKAEKFIDWLEQERRQNPISVKEISSKFPVYWNMYLNH